MGDRGTSDNRIRSRPAVVALRVASAVVAVAVLANLTSDLAGKSAAPAVPEREHGATPAPNRVPAAGSAGSSNTDERRRPRPEPLVRASAPTVYDAQRHLGRCTRSRQTIGAASRRAGLGDGIRAIARRLERIRELEFDRRIDTRLVGRSEVGERFVRGYLRQYTDREAEQDAQVLAALRLVPEGTDIRAIETARLSDGVSGFYNPRKKRLFAASSAGRPTPFEEVVLAHELDHALVDQVLKLPGTVARDPMLADTVLAHQALAEGDATLAMTRYAAERLASPELDAFLARYAGATVQARPGVPYVLVRSGAFPYYEGLLFACSAWRRDGWDAVNEMYVRPPSTTADVVFPSRYRDGNEAELPPSPPTLGPRWNAVAPRSFGAFDLMLLLENADLLSTGTTVPGSHADAVRGWDGGVLHAWLRGAETAIRVALVDVGVETRNGRRRHLCGVLRRWLLESFPELDPRATLAGAQSWEGGGEVAALRCKGRSVELAKAPAASALRRLLRR